MWINTANPFHLDLAPSRGHGVQVAGAKVSCQKVTDAPAVTWDTFTAMRVFFGPLPPPAVTDVPAALAPLLGWCPLPLSWPKQDGV